MNAYDIVDNMINKELRNEISDNELRDMGRDGKIVLAILKAYYNAKYVESFDAHFCGSWTFDNPNFIAVNGYSLESCYHGYTGTFSKHFCSDNFMDFAKEIVRLDNPKRLKGEKKLEVIAEVLSEEPHVYVGDDRLWRLVPTVIHVSPNNKRWGK